MQLTEHFNLKEFLHNGDTDGLTIKSITNLTALAHELEHARVFLGNIPIHITSGFRTVPHNKAIGGVPFSQHLYGRAADFVVPGLTPTQVYEKLDPTWAGGLGHYPDKPDRPGWVHMDDLMVPPRRRWER